jgi:SNF2 family DNA or RNA helicase
MKNIQININSTISSFELSGDTRDFISNTRAKIFLNDYLDVDYSNPDLILVKYTPENKEEVLSNVRNIIKKLGYSEQKTNQLNEVLQDYFEEERKFTEFSSKAKSIRNNHYNLKDFKHFTEIISKALPNRTLYSLQLLSAYHMAFAQNACNFSVPGAGKTSIVYGAFAYLKSLPISDPKHIDKLLIIGPLNSFGPWEDEYKDCFGNEINIKDVAKRLSGSMSQAEKSNYFYKTQKEITLTSYQGVSSIADDLVYFLKSNKVMVVLDEAHKIKNTEGGLWAEAVLKIAPHCKSRIILTGTPAPNGFEDLYNLYNFIWPDKNIIKFHLFQLKDMKANDSRTKQLVENTSPFFIRIKKSDLNLPIPNNHKPIVIKMGSSQQEIYDFIEKSYLDYASDLNKKGGDIKSKLVKARMIRLMQASTNPSLLRKPIDEYYEEQDISDDIFIDDSFIIKKIKSYKTNEIPQKFIETGKLIKEIISRGEKAVIWTTFVQNIFDLGDYLKSIGVESKALYGAIPVDNDKNIEGVETREKIIRDFHNPNSKFKVILANPFAVSESISLHKACNNAIYIERTFNAANFIQSKDRIHRVGLKPTDIVNYYYILSDTIIDNQIHIRLDEKEKNMLAIVESEPIPLINLNMDYEDDTDNDFKAVIKEYVRRNKKSE